MWRKETHLQWLPASKSWMQAFGSLRSFRMEHNGRTISWCCPARGLSCTSCSFLHMGRIPNTCLWTEYSSRWISAHCTNTCLDSASNRFYWNRTDYHICVTYTRNSLPLTNLSSYSRYLDGPVGFWSDLPTQYTSNHTHLTSHFSLHMRPYRKIALSIKVW